MAARLEASPLALLAAGPAYGTMSRGPKARFIPAWRNAPGNDPREAPRAVSPIHSSRSRQAKSVCFPDGIACAHPGGQGCAARHPLIPHNLIRGDSKQESSIA